MKNQIELSRNVCKISENGDLSFAPTSRDLIYLLLIGTGLLVIWLWINISGAVFAIILLVCIGVGLLRWVNQSRIHISPASGTIIWSRWFRKHKCPFRNVLRVNLFFDRREYAWSTHFVDRRKNIVEINARLELILENGHLVIGCISGENAEERALLLAQSIAKVIGVPVSTTGYIS